MGEERRFELREVLVPPTPLLLPTIESAASLDHRDEAGFPGNEVPLDERCADGHRVVDRGKELGAALSGDAVRVRNDHKPSNVVRRVPSKRGDVRRSVERNAHLGELRQVIDTSSRRCVVEVDEPNGYPIVEDDVLEADVVVAQHRPTPRVGQFAAPKTTCGVERSRRTVRSSDQTGDGGERGIGLGPFGVGRRRNFAFKEGEHLAPRTVETVWHRRTFEATAVQRPEIRVNRFRVRAGRPMHTRTDPQHAALVRDTTREDLLIHAASVARQARAT